MNIGMMWFSNDPKRTLAEKIAQAAEFYRAKYGAAPNTCFVNVAQLPEGEVACGGVTVKGRKDVLPNNFWIGVETASGELLPTPSLLSSPIDLRALSPEARKAKEDAAIRRKLYRAVASGPLPAAQKETADA